MTARTPALVAGTIGLLLALTGCAGGGGGSSAEDSTASSGGTAAAPATADDAGATRQTAVERRAVISTGRLSIRSRDVAKVRGQVRTVLAAYDGFLADERTETDRRGHTREARLVLRLPSRDFDAAMSRLSELGHLVDSSRTAKDVTTEVIDTDQRVRAQRIGLRRVEQLLGRAGSLRDVLRIEDEITRRRADLDSLLQQQKYLADQTSLATITVAVTRTAAAPAPTQAGTGFVAGLRAGWHGLVAVLTWVLTALGALVPFAPVLVLGGGAVWWARRRRAQPGT